MSTSLGNNGVGVGVGVGSVGSVGNGVGVGVGAVVPANQSAVVPVGNNDSITMSQSLDSINTTPEEEVSYCITYLTFTSYRNGTFYRIKYVDVHMFRNVDVNSGEEKQIYRHA